MSHSNDKHIAVSVVKIPGLILHKEQLLKPYFYIRKVTEKKNCMIWPMFEMLCPFKKLWWERYVFTNPTNLSNFLILQLLLY